MCTYLQILWTVKATTLIVHAHDACHACAHARSCTDELIYEDVMIGGKGKCLEVTGCLVSGRHQHWGVCVLLYITSTQRPSSKEVPHTCQECLPLWSCKGAWGALSDKSWSVEVECECIFVVATFIHCLYIMYIQVTHCASLLCRDELAIEGCLQLQQLLLETPILISDGYICMHAWQPRHRERNTYYNKIQIK